MVAVFAKLFLSMAMTGIFYFDIVTCVQVELLNKKSNLAHVMNERVRVRTPKKSAKMSKIAKLVNSPFSTNLN